MYRIEDISFLLYFDLATLYFGKFDVLFQYLFVYDPTNFSEEPIKCLPDPFPEGLLVSVFPPYAGRKGPTGSFFVIILGHPLSFGRVYDIKHYEISTKEA